MTILMKAWMILSQFIVLAIKGAKKPKSAGVTGDLPRKLLKEFPVELAKPVASLFRSIMKTNKWPNK